MHSNYGYIDEKLYFSRDMARGLALKEGDVVEYLSRKISDTMPNQVYMIESVAHENWESEKESSQRANKVSDLIKLKKKNTKAISTHERYITGQVIKKSGPFVTISTSETTSKRIEVNIGETDCAFIPFVGDEVSLLILFKTDTNVLNYSGEPIGVYRIRPFQTKIHVGKIEEFPRQAAYGIVDSEYIFFSDAIQNADNLLSKPDVGDSVVAEVISSSFTLPNYKSFNWRCIKIVKNVDPKAKKSECAEKKVKRRDENKNGISITPSTHLCVDFQRLHETKKLILSVTNESSKQLRLMGAIVREQISGLQIECKEFEQSHLIEANKSLKFVAQVTGKFYGISKLTIDFCFEGNFKIDRIIEINVTPNRNYEASEEAVGPKRSALVSKDHTKDNWIIEGDLVAGVRVKAAPRFIHHRLKPFEVPSKLIDIVLDASLSNQEIDMKLHDDVQTFDHLEFGNYKALFHTLLHLEEIALEHEFHRYDRDCAHFEREGEYLALNVDNVLESRPSIIIGDRVIARSLNEDDQNKTIYDGFIHKMKKNRVLIKFHEMFHNSYCGESYRLTFKFSRGKFIKQHNGIERIKNEEIVFPTKIKTNDTLQFDVNLDDDGNLRSKYVKRRLTWFNQKLNSIQKQAILNILRGEVRPMPYVIFGPPGTGKTSTVVELILQLYKNVGNSRLIVCAPSNSAADLITQRLIVSGILKLGELLRLVSINSIEREMIPDELHPYCAIADIAEPGTDGSDVGGTTTTTSGIQLKANSATLTSYRILISTCTAFGSVMQMKQHKPFTHAIIDEAGQCLESEAMIPISLLNRGQIVLAGDPMQLGPIVLSQFAKDRGLDVSYLVRLLDRSPYKKYIEVSFDGCFFLFEFI